MNIYREKAVVQVKKKEINGISNNNKKVKYQSEIFTFEYFSFCVRTKVCNIKFMRAFAGFENRRERERKRIRDRGKKKETERK